METLKKNLEDTKINKAQNATEHLANERTLLAWIRTSIGIMAFGFVVVKFSMFLRQISLLLGKDAQLSTQHAYSSIIGILLVALGTFVLLFSFINYKQTEKQLNSQVYKSSSVLMLSLILVLIAISIVLLLFLIENMSNY